MEDDVRVREPQWLYCSGDVHRLCVLTRDITQCILITHFHVIKHVHVIPHVITHFPLPCCTDLTWVPYRYVMKDTQVDHHHLHFLCEGCDVPFLLRCLKEYQAVSIWRWCREAALNPDNYYQHVVTYERKHLTPLDIHPIQVIRVMLLEGFWIVGEKWAKPGVCMYNSKNMWCNDGSAML